MDTTREEQEIGRHGSTEYAGGDGYNMNLAATPSTNFDDDERGRQPHRAGVTHTRKPFDDDTASSLRRVGSRPIDTSAN